MPALLVFLLAGCAVAPPSPSVSVVTEPVAAPLKLCPVVDSPPKELAGVAGYVQFLAVATSSSGTPLVGLKASDFSVYSQTHAFPIRYFRSSADEPVSIAIIVDESGSMESKFGAVPDKRRPPTAPTVVDRTKIETVRDSLRKALEGLNSCDEIAVLTFGGQIPDSAEETHARNIAASHGGYSGDAGVETKIRLVQPLTTDHALALSRVADLQPYGQTPLYDAIEEGLKVLAGAHYSNRELIVITDGMDNYSASSRETVRTDIARSGIAIYAVGIGDPNATEDDLQIAVGPFIMGDRGNKVDAKSLESIAAASGGHAFIVSPIAKNNSNELSEALATIVSLQQSSYSIGAVAPPGVDTSSIKFAVSTNPDASVHASIVSSAPIPRP